MRKIIIFILFIVVIIAVIVIFRVPIAEVKCESQFGSCNQSVHDIILSYKGKPVLTSFTSLNDSLKTTQWVSEYKITFIFPDKFQIDVLERKPSVAMKPYEANDATLYESSGRVIGVGEVKSLPVIEFQTKEYLAPENFSFIARLASELDNMFGIESASIHDQGLFITGVNQTMLIYPYDGDLDRLLGATRLVLWQLNHESENSTMKTIDFRYKNPVLK